MLQAKKIWKFVPEPDASEVDHLAQEMQVTKNRHFLKLLVSRNIKSLAQAKACSAAPDAHQQRHKPKKRTTTAPPTQPTVLAVSSPALPAPVRVAIQQLEGQARWGENMKVIIAPQPQPRISTAGAEPVFSAMQPLEYLPERTWASSYLEART
jgi:hypothetical protein